MSEKKESSKFGLVRTIMAILALGESGQLDNFFMKQVKAFKKDIAKIEHNLETVKMTFNNERDDLKEEIEDANLSLEHSYAEIDPEEINSNEKQKEFAVRYWRNIEAKERAIDQLEERLENLTDENKDSIKGFKSQIKAIEARINKIG